MLPYTWLVLNISRPPDPTFASVLIDSNSAAMMSGTIRAVLILQLCRYVRSVSHPNNVVTVADTRTTSMSIVLTRRNARV